MDIATQQLTVCAVHNVIVAHVIGAPTIDTVKERHARILHLASDNKCNSVLFNALEMEAPSNEVMELQRQLNLDLRIRMIRLAIIVPNYRLAYLARLVFGDEDHHVIYNDLKAGLDLLLNFHIHAFDENVDPMSTRCSGVHLHERL
jgi:hypothetical protein